MEGNGNERRRFSSASPYEVTVGFSRAVRVGDRILVAGTAPIGPDGKTFPGDAEAQAGRCLAIIVEAIEALGGTAGDVVRTRMYVTQVDHWPRVGQAHSEFFGNVMPASTLVEVSALVNPDLLVEIEVDAVVD